MKNIVFRLMGILLLMSGCQMSSAFLIPALRKTAQTAQKLQLRNFSNDNSVDTLFAIELLRAAHKNVQQELPANVNLFQQQVAQYDGQESSRLKIDRTVRIGERYVHMMYALNDLSERMVNDINRPTFADVVICTNKHVRLIEIESKYVKDGSSTGIDFNASVERYMKFVKDFNNKDTSI
jgi:hypothetical protein